MAEEKKEQVKLSKRDWSSDVCSSDLRQKKNRQKH